MINLSKPDLTQHPPRSGRVMLGGWAHLARMTDKARAHLAGKLGEYHWNCPMDQQFFSFTGITEPAFLAEVKKGENDWKLLEWVNANTKRTPSEAAAWSVWIAQHGPGGPKGHAWMGETTTAANPERTDIRSFYDLLDLDDYTSFGGKA